MLALLLKLLGKRVAVGRYANVRFSKRETVGGEASAGEKGGNLDGNLARTANKTARASMCRCRCKEVLLGSRALEC